MATRVPPPPPPPPANQRKLRCPPWIEAIGVGLGGLFVVLYPLMLLGTIPNPLLDNNIYFDPEDTSCTSLGNYYAMHWWMILKGFILVMSVLASLAIVTSIMLILAGLVNSCCLDKKPCVCCSEQEKQECYQDCVNCCSPYEQIA